MAYRHLEGSQSNGGSLKRSMMTVARVTAVFTGMRPGEMLALRWSDLVLDDSEPVARVRRSLSKDDNGRLVAKSTKTETGRAIALLPQVVETLRDHRKRQAEQRLRYSGLWRDEDLVFPSKTGSPMSWDNLVRRNLKPLVLTISGTPSPPSCSNRARTPRSSRRYWATPA
jgi:integrase